MIATVVEITRAVGCRETLRYQHQRAVTEQLLAIPDAVAWCWAKGGDWRRRIEPALAAVRRVWRPDSAKPGSPTVRMAAGLTS